MLGPCFASRFCFSCRSFLRCAAAVAAVFGLGPPPGVVCERERRRRARATAPSPRLPPHPRTVAHPVPCVARLLPLDGREGSFLHPSHQFSSRLTTAGRGMDPLIGRLRSSPGGECAPFPVVQPPVVPLGGGTVPTCPRARYNVAYALRIRFGGDSVNQYPPSLGCCCPYLLLVFTDYIA